MPLIKKISKNKNLRCGTFFVDLFQVYEFWNPDDRFILSISDKI